MIIFINPPKRKRPAKTKPQAKPTNSSTSSTATNTARPCAPSSKTKVQAPPKLLGPPRPLIPNGHDNNNGLNVDNGPPPSYSSSAPFLPSLEPPNPNPKPNSHSQAVIPYPQYTSPLQNPWNNASYNATTFAPDPPHKTINSIPWSPNSTDQSSGGQSINDLICTRFNDLITLIDGETFSGDEKELGTITCSQYL